MKAVTLLFAVSFLAYFALIFYCDVNRPEAFGATLRAGENGLVVEAVDNGSPAARAGLRVGDAIVAAAGVPTRGALDWNAALANIEFGRELPLDVARQRQRLRAPLVFNRVAGAWFQSPEGLLLLLFRIVQLVTLLVAIAMAIKPTGLIGQLGAGFLATVGVYCLALPYRLATVWRAVPIAAALTFWIPLTSTLVVGGTLFAFFASFPNRRYSGTRLLGLCIPFVFVALWEARFIAAAVYRSEPVSAIPDQMLWIVALNLAYVVGGVIALLRNYRLVKTPGEARRIRVVVTGCCVGSAAGAGPIAAYWLGLDSNLSAMYAPSPLLLLAFAVFMVLPISFWYAIVRHQLFDLRLVVRHGVAFVLTRRAILAAGPLIGAALVLDGIWHQSESVGQLVRRHLWWYTAAGAIFGALQFWREPVLALLDQRLFRERHNACSLLRAVVAQIRSASDLRAVSPTIIQQVESALHPAWIALLVRARGDEFFHSVASMPAAIGPWPARTRLLDFVRALHKPLDLDLPDAEWVVDRLPNHEADTFGDSGAHLILPIVMDAHGYEAMLVLGRKRSDEPFDREDKELLLGIAESVHPLIEPYLYSLRPPIVADRDMSAVVDGAALGRIGEIASAVASGYPVEWDGEISHASVPEQRVLKELRTLASIAGVHRRSHDRAHVLPQQWGPFHLREVVGSGTFGTVYRAWDPNLDQEVAVKLLRGAPRGGRSRFEEGRLMARVRHPNVVSVYGADEVEGIPGVWMEFIHGQTLKAVLQTQDLFGADEAAVVGAVVSRALAAVHRAGLLHQDIKAQNVMRERGGRLVLMDFGEGIGVDELTVPSGGTPLYMAPELFMGAPASPQTDLYAVGVLLFHLVTGVFPVEGRTYAELQQGHAQGRRRWLRDLRPNLDDRFVSVVERTLESDPSRRFASAGGLELALTSENT